MMLSNGIEHLSHTESFKGELVLAIHMAFTFCYYQSTGKQFQQTHFNSPSQSTNFGGATQLFEDTSHYHDPGMVQQQQQQPMQQQQPQMFPGAQFVNDPMANMALQYGSTMASTGKEFMEQKVRMIMCLSEILPSMLLL